MNHRVVAHVVVLAAMCALPAVAGANVTPPPPPLSTAPGLTWEVKGGVNALERQGNTLFVGGSFSYVGPPNARLGAVVSAQTAEAPLGLPRIVGSEVRAVLPDGSGGWFIGGRFTSVGGIACQNLAHVRADLTVDPAFCGTIDMGGGSSGVPVVNALAKGATKLYLGGRFARVRSSQRSNLAALTLTTGAVAGFDAGPVEWAETIPGIQGCQRECLPEVHALALDTKLFVAGNFTSIAGTQRWGLAALNPSTGGVRLAFGPTPSRFNRGHATPTQEGDESEFQVPLRALTLGGGRLYLGGDFDHINGHALESEPLHGGIAAVDPATGALVTTFAARIPVAALGPTVKAIAVVGTTVFVGGDFSSVIQTGTGTFPRSNLAAITAGGAVLPWRPDPDDDVNSVVAASGGAVVIVGGPFTAIGGASRDRVAAVIAPGLSPQGALTNWAPALLGSPGQVNALAVAGDAAYVGGDFSAIGGVRRTSLAAFDLTTGRPTAWAPVPTSTSGVGSSISSLARVGSALYLGGEFDAISGVSRAKLAAVATDTGVVLPWHPPDVAPGLNNHVSALAANAAAVFVGGDFIDGFAAPFNLAVALDPTTGVPLPWPGAPVGIYQSGRPSVNEMTLSGSTLFMVGNFAGASTALRRGIVAVDAATGAVSPFNANVSGGIGPPRDVAVRALTASTSRAYLVGPNAFVGGQARSGAASVDGATGALTDWAPSFSGGAASSVLLSGPDVLIGTSGGAIRSFSLDAPAVPGTFSATGDGGIRDLISGPDASVIAGGSFGSIGGRDQQGIAIFVRAVPVSVGQSNAVVGKRDRWSAPVRCPRAAARRCVIDASLQETATRARSVIGRARLTVRAGGARRAVFILTPRGRGLLRRRARLPAVVRVVATDARGTVTKGERSFKLRFPSS
jgi:hypothetical protein